MLNRFRWNDWNLQHATAHGISVSEAEYVANSARAPFPDACGDDKWRVWGPTSSGRLVQVIYVVDDDDTFYIIHARPLNEREKKRLRRRLR